ncbi:hypothetical protein HGRIS_014375 [Hohenbuehelia grisea]|uniref:Autophagy-related protein 13 n=1 Tax=Hohenbuehelia grisea TaxID=104357 RepID=A0ABR3JU25_9AGAR
MSNETQKADQIAFHLYTKLFYVVNHARATAEPRNQSKPDKWFNLETPDSELFTKDARDPYKSLSSYTLPAVPPPLEIQVLLVIPELAPNQVLVHMATDITSSHVRTRIDPTPRFILLESHSLSFAHHYPNSSFNSSTLTSSNSSLEVAPSTIYKHGIPLFRSLFSLLRILPAWKVLKRLKRRTGLGGRNGNMGIVVRLRGSEDIPLEDVLEFNTPLSLQSQTMPGIILPTNSHTFPSVPHPSGSLTLVSTYLTSPHFQLDELESLLSSRFLAGDRKSQAGVSIAAPPDPDVEFVPTLVKNQQRDSIASSAGTGYRESGSFGGARDRDGAAHSIADRFVVRSSSSGGSALPPASTSIVHTRTTSLSALARPSSAVSASTGLGAPPGMRSRTSSPRTSPRKSSVGLPSIPVGIPGSSTGRASNPSSYTSGSSLQHPMPFPATHGGAAPLGRPLSRLRTASNSSTAAPSGLGLGLGLPGSLPQTSALSHQLSPIHSSTLPPTPIRPLSNLSPIAINPFKAGSLASGGGVGGSLGTTGAGLLTRASPPSVASSYAPPATQGHGISDAVRPGPVPVPAQRKRYSSSFGHRYTGAGSGGSGGSVGVNVVGPSGGSVGSGGPVAGSVGSSGRGGDPKGKARRESASFLGTTTDDDDISHFVQELDAAARKPLSGRRRQEASDSDAPSIQPHSRSASLERGTEEVEPGLGRYERDPSSRRLSEAIGGLPSPSPSSRERVPLSALGRASSVPRAPLNASSEDAMPLAAGSSPMLTNADEVEERLRKMNEAFLASLEGLGGSSTSGSVAASGASSGITGPSGSGSTTRREREFGTLGRGRDWRALGMGGPSSDSRVTTEESPHDGRGMGPRERPTPFIGRFRERNAGDSGSSSEVGGLGGSGGSGGSGLGQGSEEVIGRMDMDAEGDGLSRRRLR